MGHKKTKRKGAASGLHYPKEAVTYKNKGAELEPPGYLDKNGPPGYFATEDEFLEDAKKKKFDLTFRAKSFSQEKLASLEGEKKFAALNLTLRIKPSPVTKEKPLLTQDEKKFAALDLAIRPKPPRKPTQQEIWITSLKLSVSQAAPFPLPPGVCTKDPVCTCGGVFEYKTDISEAYGETFRGLRPSTKSREECMEKFGLLSRFRSTEWCAWSNAHEEVSEDES